MSDLTDQMAGFQKKWMEQQQQMLDDWLKTLQGTQGATPSASWQQAIDAIEQQVNNTLDVQKQSLLTLAENTWKIENVPDSFTQWSQQVVEGIEQWDKVQHRLWRTWFDLLRTASPVEGQSQDLFAGSWQDFADRAMEIQEQWLSNWTEMQPKAGKSAGKKKSKPKAGKSAGKKKPKPKAGKSAGKKKPKPKAGKSAGKKKPKPKAGKSAGKKKPKPKAGKSAGKKKPKPKAGKSAGKKKSKR